MDYYNIEGTVLGVKDLPGGITEVELSAVSFYRYCDLLLLSEQLPTTDTDYEVVSIPADTLRWVEDWEINSKARFLVSDNEGELTVQPSNFIAGALFRALDTKEVIEQRVAANQEVFQETRNLRQQLSYLKNNYLTHRFVPDEVTRPQVELLLETTSNYLDQVELAHPELLKKTVRWEPIAREELLGVLKDSKTTRTGLKKMVIDQMEAGETNAPDVIVTCQISDSQRKAAETSCFLNDVVVREYNPNRSVQDSPIIDKIDSVKIHLNDKTARYLRNLDGEPVLSCRVNFMRRKTGEFDFGLRMQNWAPGTRWINQYRGYLKSLQEAQEINDQETIDQLLPEIEKIRGLLSQLDTMKINPEIATLEELQKGFTTLEERFESLQSVNV